MDSKQEKKMIAKYSYCEVIHQNAQLKGALKFKKRQWKELLKENERMKKELEEMRNGKRQKSGQVENEQEPTCNVG